MNKNKSGKIKIHLILGRIKMTLQRVKRLQIPKEDFGGKERLKKVNRMFGRTRNILTSSRRSTV